jgi:acetolactate synthase-1/2/3 large subunit
VRRAVEADRTTVIDVPMDPEENVFPMVPPGKGLKEFIMEA